ncbi:MAG: HAD family hydrolase [Methanomicrobiales archaeon]|nr:HAD family hydrolase [Methanomicrobiales archaeon]
MDNTLFDFVAAKRHACCQVAEFLGRKDGEELFEYFLHKEHGFENPENIRDYLIDRTCFSEEVFAECVRIYKREKLSVLVSYPRMHEILNELRRKSMKLAVLTDAHRDNALLRLEHLGLRQYFDHVITADMTGTRKPAQEPFLLALRLLDVMPEETLLIGDSIRRDIAPGKTLGMITAYARYGDRNLRTPSLCTPDIIFDSIQDMVDLLPFLDGE